MNFDDKHVCPQGDDGLCDDCPCHQPGGKIATEKLLSALEKYPQAGEGWEKEFEASFGIVDYDLETTARLMNFIRRTIAAATEETKSETYTRLQTAFQNGFEAGRAAERQRILKQCVCGESWTLGVVHRTDKPCYWPPRELSNNQQPK